MTAVAWSWIGGLSIACLFLTAIALEQASTIRVLRRRLSERIRGVRR